MREAGREAGRELGAELPRELPLDDCLDWAFLEVVLPLSRALRRRSSCMTTVVEMMDKVGGTKKISQGVEVWRSSRFCIDSMNTNVG